MRIAPFEPSEREAVVALALTAWSEVFDALRRELPPIAWSSFYPEGWEARQSADIGALLDREGALCRTAWRGDALAGFVAMRLHPADRMGEVHAIVVHPAHRVAGVASALMAHAEETFRREGLSMSFAETGADAGHVPARGLYEAAGYERWPVMRYVKAL